MSNGLDRELGETDARLSALEGRMVKMEAQNAEMLKVLYMGRGITWMGGVVAAVAGLIATGLAIWSNLREP